MTTTYTARQGTRTRAGTDWPIYSTLTKDGPRARPWRITWSICNGIAQGTDDYRTKAEALAVLSAGGAYSVEER